METNTMTREQYLALVQKGDGGKRRHDHLESNIQRQCVSWFRIQFPDKAKLLFAVPNGGARSRAEAGIMMAEGVTAGVADLILLEAHGGYGALCIEMKTKKKSSKQSERQKQWAEIARRAGNKYSVVKSLEEFIEEVTNYLKMQ